MSHPLHTFHLSDSDLTDYIDKQPKWANLLAYITYKRTYSRDIEGGKEEYWQTVRRVVEGVFSIQKNHCKSLRLPWSDNKAKRSALEMFRQMWEFKWLPPGRGLWMMGTDYMFNHGAAALMNCWFVSTEEISTDFAAPFVFMMDRSMLGGGVGFDLDGAGTIKIRQPKWASGERYIVEDSREGWLNVLARVINSFVGKTTLPEAIDYSQIRLAGAPIKGFGGVSAGPEPLSNAIDSIILLLRNRIGEKITSIDILDMMNYIGKCVVSGNVRRSAQICIGPIDDTEYQLAKSPKLFPDELMDRRWASNNSVSVSAGSSYGVAATKTAVNGEPGYVWLDNARNYGRIRDGKNNTDRRVKGLNPCQPDFATVLTPQGIRTFKDIGIGSVIWSGKCWTWVTNKVRTGVKEVFNYETSAGHFLGTENHRVVSNGVKIEAQDATSIDVAKGHSLYSFDLDPFDIMDGLVIGDGSVHKASNNLVYLIVGEKDSDYFTSEIKDLLVKDRPGLHKGAYEIETTITKDELPFTFHRTIPDRFFFGDARKVCGFLRGLYTANGSVVNNRITLKQTSYTLIRQVQEMLSAVGIQSYITTNKPTLIDHANGQYQSKESYDLNINSDRNEFIRLIGFIQEYKNKKISVRDGKARNSFEIISKKSLGYKEVYDITVSDPEHTYWTGGVLVSNCGEITLESWEACNLSETFPAHHDSLEEYQRTIKMAYMYSKTVTLLSTHDERTNSVIMRNRRIGLSQSGIVQAINKLGRRQFLNWCDSTYSYVQTLDATYSEWLCVPKSIKTTTVKPSGTISLLAGATPGMHYPHSEYYIRRVRFGKDDPIVKTLKEAGYGVETDSYNTGAMVVSFPVKESNYIHGKDDVTMWDQLELAAALQYFWADNSVSCTVTFTEDEAPSISKALRDYENHLKSISFLPIKEHGYAQAPYECISERVYEEMLAELKEPDFKLFNEAKHQEIRGCDGDSCTV